MLLRKTAGDFVIGTGGASVSTTGNVGLDAAAGNLSFSGANFNFSGNLALRASGTINVSDQSIDALGTLSVNAASLQLRAPTTVAQLTSGGAMTVATSGDLTVAGGTGSTGPASRFALLYSTTSQSITVGGNLQVTGGDTADSSAQILTTGQQNVNVAGNVQVAGGSGDNAFASIDPVLPNAVMNFTAGGDISLAGGTGAGSYAEISASSVSLRSVGDISLAGGTGPGSFASITAIGGPLNVQAGSDFLPTALSLIPGTGQDADAVLGSLLPGGTSIYMGSCIGCVDLGATNPFGNLILDSGVFGAPITLNYLSPASSGPSYLSDLLSLFGLFSRADTSESQEEDEEGQYVCR